MSMAKKKEDSFETKRPTTAHEARSGSYQGARAREATPSAIKLSPASAAARPLATPRSSGVADADLRRSGPRAKLPEAPELTASDVEWWAEATLNTTFDPSRVVAIDDPNDPNHGDRITPVFLESITPVFPESKVREVMALADAYERASSSGIKVVAPAVRKAPAPPVPGAVAKKSAPPAAMTPPAPPVVTPVASPVPGARSSV
ncbi:MAG TPA: hypothetical protein VNO21_16455, partial [Polyangiaceae bacterium]|nr:hypothetical protein [Polyangiaceae bacterium]